MWLLVLLSLVSADVYMHSPRGANDRNCERNVNRNNGNLLYDTQNNAKGGYACPRAVAANNAAVPLNGLTPRMIFEEGSKLEVEWTAQHGCGLQKEDVTTSGMGNGANNGNVKTVMAQNSNVHCEMVIQMACAKTLDPTSQYTTAGGNADNGLPGVPREGIPNSDGDAATNRIGTTDPGQAQFGANAGNTRFGVHETPEYYNECNRVQRNRGLFTADQNVNRRSAIGTRQNPNGGRRGLECPEERDYYPYWRPAPFMDVAYLVDDSTRCGTTVPCGGTAVGATKCQGVVNTGDWVGNAQGFMAGGATNTPGSCVIKATGKVPKTQPNVGNAANRLYNRREWPATAAACAKLITDNNAAATVEWKPMMFHAQFDMASPANAAIVANANAGAECNTLDYSRSNHLGNSGSADTATRYTMTMPKVNAPAASVATVGAACTGCIKPEGEPCLLRLRYNMSSSDYDRNATSALNGDASPIQQDPLVKVGTRDDDVVQLALNTNQVARTFQDRSYVFYVKPRPANRPTAAVVMNMNARGKRGNIVQTYPAVEYDLIPNIARVTADTVLAVQWTGSDYNPRRGCNDGEGGPYTGDNNVAARLINNANTQGSNQNSRTDRQTLLAINLGSKKNYPYKDPTANAAASTTLMYGANQLFSDITQARKFMTADAINQLAQLQAQSNAGNKANIRCLTATEINNINNENRQENDPRNCAEGNALSPYFSTEEITFTANQVGDTYTLFSARNNNFSNRDTKMKVIVETGTTTAVTPNSIPQEFTVSSGSLNDLYSDKTYDPVEGSYDTATEIDGTAEADIPGFDPVENDDYGSGATEGCTQEMIFYAGASSQYSFNLATFGFCLMYALF